jgi:3-oxoacyl-[acyl-carrier protein] reductase
MIDLTGHRVLVTGGSRGIGAACCRLFSQAGAAVLVHYRANEGAARAVLAGLPPSSAGTISSSPPTSPSRRRSSASSASSGRSGEA